MMLLDLSLFFFVLLGSKLVMGAIAVYLLLPRDSTCAICDAEMLPIMHARGTVRLLRLLRVQRHWCMECRRETLTRRMASARSRHMAPLPVAETRLR
jgi:hypothetical protein